MIKPSLSQSSGFTIIEILLYCALFITISAMLIGSLLGMMRGYNGTRINNDLLDSGQVAMERMTREIRGAVSVNTGSSTFATSPGVLVLNSLDSGGSAKTVRFGLSSGVLQITDSTDGTARDLTGSKITVTSLVFRNVVTTNDTAVRVEMTLQSNRSGTGKSITLYNTIVLRGGY